MNPKIILAFAGGVLLAGGAAFFMSSGSDKRQDPSGSMAQTPAAVQDVATAQPEVIAPVEPPWPKASRTKAVKASASSPTPAAKQPVLVAKSDPPAVNLPAPNPRPAESNPTANTAIANPDPAPRQAPKPVREPATVTIPVGTSIAVRINSTLTTKQTQTGETFTGTLASPIVVDDMVIAEKGARVDGRVSESTPSGRVKGKALLAITLTQLTTSDGQKIAIRTDPFVREGASSVKNDAVKVGAGAAVGATLGAIFGGGKGAAIGAASGGAAGTGVVLATRGKPAQIDVETRIPFRLASAVTVTEQIR